MAKIITERQDLVNIANEVRNLQNINNDMTLYEISSNLENVNNEVNLQANLINQINAALEGKAAGSSGGSQITGETCTVTFPNHGSLGAIFYYLNEEYRLGTFNEGYSNNGPKILTVLKNSILISNMNCFGDQTFTCEGQPLTLLKKDSNSSADAYAVIIHGDVVFGYASGATS